MSELSRIWFEEAKKLQFNEAIFIRVANKLEQTSVARELELEKEQLAITNTILSSQLFINKTLKNGKQYVVIERKYRAPFEAFFKNSSGEFSKISIDPDRQRQLYLMIKDGYSKEKIEEAMNGLTESELNQHFPEKEKE